ncbi:unnamed protein product, partial [marine sediment metagenome]
TYDPELAHRYLYGPAVDQILAVEDGSGDILWGLAGHQGTIRDVVEYDGQGAVLDTHVQYDAFGGFTGATLPSVDFLFAFTGRPVDLETGLYDYRARWYDPEVGRFLTEDPAGLSADANLYRYAGNSPVIYVDPSGLCKTKSTGSGLYKAGSTGGFMAAAARMAALAPSRSVPLSARVDSVMRELVGVPGDPRYSYPSELYIEREYGYGVGAMAKEGYSVREIVAAVNNAQEMRFQEGMRRNMELYPDL